MRGSSCTVPDVEADGAIRKAIAVSGIGANIYAVSRKPSAPMTFDDARALADVMERLANECRGIVATHGTDTLEEMAFMLDATLLREIPVIVTDAVRPEDQPDADGVAQLRRVAALSSP